MIRCFVISIAGLLIVGEFVAFLFWLKFEPHHHEEEE